MISKSEIGIIFHSFWVHYLIILKGNLEFYYPNI